MYCPNKSIYVLCYEILNTFCYDDVLSQSCKVCSQTSFCLSPSQSAQLCPPVLWSLGAFGDWSQASYFSALVSTPGQASES